MNFADDAARVIKDYTATTPRATTKYFRVNITSPGSSSWSPSWSDKQPAAFASKVGLRVQSSTRT